MCIAVGLMHVCLYRILVSECAQSTALVDLVPREEPERDTSLFPGLCAGCFPPSYASYTADRFFFLAYVCPHTE